MRSNLTITPAPFKSSNLAIPPSPFSPRLPITPPAPRLRSASLPTTRKPINLRTDTPPPTEPLHWLWQCHICNRVYKLGTTRRCLDDGHFFCAGTTTVKRSRKSGKKVLKHKACASEFDYQGWKTWGTWRRSAILDLRVGAVADESGVEPLSVRPPIAPDEGEWLKGKWTKKAAAATDPKSKVVKDCWNTCDYPSECRWGKQYGAQTPTLPTMTVPSSPSPTAPVEPAKTSFEDILGELDTTTNVQEPGKDEGTPTCISDSTDPDTAPSTPTPVELLESAKRRKRKSATFVPSPLASHPPEPTSSAESVAAHPVSHFSKALDEFDIEIRRSIERYGGLVTSVVSSMRSTASREEERADNFVKALRISKKKTNRVKEGSNNA